MKRVLLFIVLALSTSVMICIGESLWGSVRPVAYYDVGDGYSIKIWEECPGFATDRWDPDHVCTAIYYEIDKSGHVIVSPTYLGLNFIQKRTFDMRAVFAEAGQLICIYETPNRYGDSLFIILDKASNESWPRLRDDEVSYDPAVEKKWADRYNRLKRENPNLPPYIW